MAAAATAQFGSLVHCAAPGTTGLGALQLDPDRLLDLLPGYTYRVLDRRGDVMSDGYRVPGCPDGMACFPGPDNTLILMRNHELDPTQGGMSPYGPGQGAPREAYDPRAMGGVTRLVVDATTFERRSSNLVLAGTTRNCGGGITPWGWMSAEESVDRGHGYVFLCAPDAESVQPPRRVTGYGRFNHEAAVVDPATSVAYLTEDRADGAFYRFVPHRADAPFEGRLQALRVVGRAAMATSGAMAPGDVVDVEWVDIDQPDPSGDTVRVEAKSRGAATFARGEGAWFAGGAVYFTATAGGPMGAGQVFRYRPDGADRGRLEVIAHSASRSELDQPDNITVSPAGVVYVTEDGPGEQFLCSLGSDGSAARFARNSRTFGELAGICFSPDGRAMFVNLLDDGVTVVVTGPFRG